MTTPNIFELLRGVKWNSFHLWLSLHNFFVPIAAWLAADLDARFAIPVRTPEDLVFARPEIYIQ